MMPKKLKTTNRRSVLQQIDFVIAAGAIALKTSFDLQVEVLRLNYDELRDGVGDDDSITVRARVLQARQRQWARLGGGKLSKSVPEILFR